MEAIEISNMTFTYPEMKKPALNNIDLIIEEGDFTVICGKSGCGKTTLLRHLKTVLTPFGERTGHILFKGKHLEESDLRVQSAEIGYVLQSPENQIVTDKVWHELAFGLESLGYDNATIRLRVAEMASFFGIQGWFKKKVTELSGGQKQLLNLASIMAMQPSLLILDEPTSQLDPIAASDFLETVKKINRELGTTIVMSEHRLEEVFPIADQVIVMDDARIIANDRPKNIGEILKWMKHDMFIAMPAPIQIYAGVNNKLACPITVREGRKWMTKVFENHHIEEKSISIIDTDKEKDKEIIIKMKDVWFRYEKNLPDTIQDLSLEVKKGDMYCIVGGNGTGKTTTLMIIAGIIKPYRGKVWINGVETKKYKDNELYNGLLGVVPQNPQSLFVKKTVELDLFEMFGGRDYNEEEKKKRVEEIVQLVHIDHLLGQHPYDLSGGEQQRLALGKILLLEPKILLLDEPTKGLDNYFKQELGYILKNLKAKGVTIVIVSHDVEFCAKYGDVCGMFFDGSVITQNTPHEFFTGNSFYTTSANRMSRHLFQNAITVEDVVALCNQNLENIDMMKEETAMNK